MARDHVPPETKDRIRRDVDAISARVRTRAELSFETAKLLFFEYGLHPSSALVYEFTQRGSMGDITTDMRAFWAWLRTSTQERLSVPGMPATLLERQGELLAEIWRLSHAEALKTLEEHRQAIDAKLNEANALTETEHAARLRAEEAEKRAEAAAGEARQAAGVANAAREAAERALAIEQAEKATALEATEQWRQSAKREVQAREQAEAQFSRDLASEREAREQEITWAKGQIEEARALTRASQERLKALDADKRTREASLGKTIEDLQARLDALAAYALARENALSDQVQQLQARLGDYALELGELRGRVTTLIEERDRALADLREERSRPPPIAVRIPRRRLPKE